MRRVAAELALAALLSACTSKAEQAEDEFMMIARSGLDPSDLCAAAGKVKRAYLEQGDEVKFQTWEAREYSACARSRRM